MNINSVTSSYIPNATESTSIASTESQQSKSAQESQLDTYAPAEYIEQYNNYTAETANANLLSTEERLSQLVDMFKSSEEYAEFVNSGQIIPTYLHNSPFYNELKLLIYKSLDENTWKKAFQTMMEGYKAGNGDYGDLKWEMLEYQSDYRNYDIDAIMNGSNEAMKNVLFSAAEQVILTKACYSESTEAEILYSFRASWIYNTKGKDATFGNQMQSVADYFDAKLTEASMQTSQGGKYTFTVDSDFKFSVTGSNNNSAEAMANLLNNDKNLVLKTVLSLFYGRNEDSSVNSWCAKYYYEIKDDYEVAYASSEYTKLMDNLFNYYNKHMHNEQLYKVFGVGFNDFDVKDGVLIGKTDKANDLINNNELFKTYHASAIANSITQELPSVDFSLIEFTLENGNFFIKIR